MYGPSSGGGSFGGAGGGGRGGGGERKMTPRGQMSGGANQRPPLSDLPIHLKAMFEPRMPIPPARKITKKQMPPYTGVAALVGLFETEAAPSAPEPPAPAELKKERREKLQKLNEERLEALAAGWDPKNNRDATEDAYKTLFVGRLSYDTTEKKLRRELEQCGPIKSIRMVVNKLTGQPRGYAFVEFENESDMHVAYKRMDGNRLDDRRIVVDVERGRTVENWKPRRLGGGLGGRKAKRSAKQILEDEKKAREAFLSGTRGFSAPPPRDSQREHVSSRSGSRDDARPRSDRGGLGYSGSGGAGGGHYGPSDSRNVSNDRDRDSRRRSRSPRGDRGMEADRRRDRDRDRDRDSSRKRRSRSPVRGDDRYKSQRRY